MFLLIFSRKIFEFCYLIRVAYIDTKCDGAETVVDSIVNQNVGKIYCPDTVIDSKIS